MYNAEVEVAAPTFTLDRVKVSKKGWFVIPAHIRKRYGITPGSRVTFVDVDDCIHLLPAIPEEVLRKWQSLEGEAAVQMARELVETYQWEAVEEGS